MKASGLVLFASLLFICCEKNENPASNNGGVSCINGHVKENNCECDQHFSGPNCTIVEEPDQILVTSVKLRNFQDTTRNGQAWDASGNGPDVFFEFVRLNNSNGLVDSVLKETEVELNASPGSTYTWSFKSAPIVINKTSQTFGINLFDRDSATNTMQFMAQNKFMVYKSAIYEDAFPYTFSSNNNQAAYDITIEYNW